METKHTQGPWLYRPQEYDDWGIVRAAALDENGYQRVICQANHVTDPTELCAHMVNGTDPAEANARLIASAPDGLELAQEFLAFAKSGANFNYPAGSLQKLEQFIAKATTP